KSEKDKMSSGEPFRPFASRLMEERERRKRAISRFSNADSPQKDITSGSHEIVLSPSLRLCWLREDSHRSPFMCEYGYSLSVGTNVRIGTSCKFFDSGRISIGRNSSIGASVAIGTRRVSSDCRTLKGSWRTTFAAKVHIVDNVYTGSN
ncbi:hypothetical protein DM02DRAFT_480159, partial [Periconia macrospinosa]